MITFPHRDQLAAIKSNRDKRPETPMSSMSEVDDRMHKLPQETCRKYQVTRYETAGATNYRGMKTVGSE